MLTKGYDSVENTYDWSNPFDLGFVKVLHFGRAQNPVPIQVTALKPTTQSKSQH